MKQKQEVVNMNLWHGNVVGMVSNGCSLGLRVYAQGKGGSCQERHQHYSKIVDVDRASVKPNIQR